MLNSKQTPLITTVSTGQIRKEVFMRIVTCLVLLSVALFLSGCATMGPAVNEKSLKTEIDKLKSENGALTAERDTYKSDTERLSKDAGKVKTQLTSLQDSLLQEKQKASELESRIEILSSELQSLKGTAVSEAPNMAAPDDFTKKVQLALYAAGFDPGKIDGKMGPQTVQAIKNFQEANGIKVDGVAGKGTWEKLQGYLEMK